MGCDSRYFLGVREHRRGHEASKSTDAKGAEIHVPILIKGHANAKPHEMTEGRVSHCACSCTSAKPCSRLQGLCRRCWSRKERILTEVSASLFVLLKPWPSLGRTK
ncbi:hypothetical protein SAMN04488504_108316 [Myxococcus virescens]|uniref:Uncharacterized protein n=1 Tax=Myxococcus virescens TaxID=83456 RepID=A0ABY0MVB1_9BACT|nr:hypothetical protein SAMN04488504_108316 [Myxococcus virescens]